MFLKLACISAVSAWKFWKSETKLRKAIEAGIISHINPRHTNSPLQRILFTPGEKSLFLMGTSDVDIEELLYQTLLYPTFELTRFRIKITETTGYKIYKRLICLHFAFFIIINVNLS